MMYGELNGNSMAIHLTWYILVQTKLYQTLVMKLNVSLDFSAYIAQI